jgi:hypothetical protein
MEWRHSAASILCLAKKMKLKFKIAGGLLAFVILLVASCIGYMFWHAHLPSDTASEVFFQEHRAELNTIITSVEREPKIDFVSADWVGNGADANDPAHVACAKLLKRLGAQFLRRDNGAIEIFFWGDGCAFCHDSYKGYAYIPSESGILKLATEVRSLDDKSLPKGKYAPIEDGTYISPLIDTWYLIRWECG